MRPDRSNRLTVLALTSLLTVALGGVLLRVPALTDAGLVLLGVGSGIVLRTYLSGRG